MSQLEKFKIKSAPKALQSFAIKHNELVDLLEGLQGTNGIRINVSAGVILISINATAVKTSGGGTIDTGGGGDGGGDGGTASSVSSSSGGSSITADASGVVVTKGTVTATIDADAGVTVSDSSSGNSATIDSSGTVTVTNGSNGHSLEIVPTDIGRPMSIKTIDICTGDGTSQSIDILASDPY